MLRELGCYARSNSRALYCGFVDCKAAFDRVLRMLLFLKLAGFLGVEDDSWRVLNKMYETTSAQIGEKCLNILSGIREGGLSSPGCFNIYINDLVTILKETGDGFQVGIILLCVLLFADDIVLISHTPNGLQNLLNVLWKFAVDNHMSFGIHKCAVVCFEPESGNSEEMPEEKMSEVPQATKQDFEFKLGDTVLEVTNYYKYLGIEEALNDNYQDFLKRKRQEVTVTLLEVEKVGGRRGGLRALEARRLYITKIRPKIEYGITVMPYRNDILDEL